MAAVTTYKPWTNNPDSTVVWPDLFAFENFVPDLRNVGYHIPKRLTGTSEYVNVERFNSKLHDNLLPRFERHDQGPAKETLKIHASSLRSSDIEVGPSELFCLGDLLRARV
jgi:hypothetical protein